MKLEEVSIQYQQTPVIQSINLAIERGEIFVLMGPSGSGKTTLLKAIAGLIPLSSGHCYWDKGQGTTGLVFQEPRLFPHLTVMENIAFGLKVKGIPRKDRERQVQGFLRILQLEGMEQRYPHQLSGGQQQRVSLGRALIMKPDLLLLDEPFASLDTQLRADLIEWLYQLQRELDFSILWVTHYMDEAFSVADRIGVLMDGNLLQIGTPSKLFSQPSSEKVAGFLSLPNRFSVMQWHKWIPEIDEGDTRKMGWVPANALTIVKHSHPFPKEKQGIHWINGIVKRVKHEAKGNTVLIESEGAVIEVGLTVNEEVPQIQEQVKFGVQPSYIRWYPID